MGGFKSGVLGMDAYGKWCRGSRLSSPATSSGTTSRTSRGWSPKRTGGCGRARTSSTSITKAPVDTVTSGDVVFDTSNPSSASSNCRDLSPALGTDLRELRCSRLFSGSRAGRHQRGYNRFDRVLRGICHRYRRGLSRGVVDLFKQLREAVRSCF